jgi:hypothetical protein
MLYFVVGACSHTGNALNKPETQTRYEQRKKSRHGAFENERLRMHELQNSKISAILLVRSLVSPWYLPGRHTLFPQLFGLKTFSP